MRIPNKSEPDIETSLIFGGSGAGKTHLCATWPRVAWFGSAREGGFETMRYMDPSVFYERDRPPMIFAVSSMPEMLGHINKDVMPLVKKGEVKTLVIELSFYAGDIITALKPMAGKNGWMPYVSLLEHIEYIDKMVKSTPGLSVCYNTLSSGGDSEKSPGGILVPGQAVAKQIPAMCKLTGYLRTGEHEGVVSRYLHLQPYGTYMPRHRYGNRLPGVIKNPTFRILQRLLAGELVCDAEGNVSELGAAPEIAVVRKPLRPLGGEKAS